MPASADARSDPGRTVQDESDAMTTWLRPTALPGVEMMFAYENGRRWRVFHERYVICTCDSAATTWRYRGRSHVWQGRAFALMEPGETHFNHGTHKPSDFQVLFLSPEVVGKFADELALPGVPHFRMAQDNNPEFFRACRQLFAAAETETTVLEQQSRLAVCARFLLTHYTERRSPALPLGGTHRGVERARRYLHERVEEPVTLDELCVVAGLSRFHLLRTFADHVGMPPHVYQIRMQIERARTLLQTGMPPSLVASALGFADQSHFTRHFKRVLDTTPRRYARAGPPTRGLPYSAGRG